MRNHPLWQLTLVRFREFLREPEALFWVFGFPLLLAAGLGLAFRNTPAEVLSIGVEHVVEFSVEAGEALDADVLRTLEGVRDVRTDNGVVRMQVTALHSAVPALLAELVRRGIRLTELRTHSATLEDVFVTLTGRHLRDA